MSLSGAPEPRRGARASGGSDAVRLSWQPSSQTSGLLVRWSPARGPVFLPPQGGVLPPGTSSYVDTGPLQDATYCWVLFPLVGDLAAPDVRGTSDLLCLLTHTATGASPPGNFRIQLNESTTVRLDWTPPGGQDRYALHALRFDGTPEQVLPLLGHESTFGETIGNQARCYRLVALIGVTPLGGTDMICAVAGIASFP